ncbi:hypothetical protein EVC62_12570 [Salinicola endophyticus]|uniref:DUF1439 domain-containing protein n=1 Tax=Salinicola endophyticus TaxID=1949083 RepID=A0ABY8FHH5_9GAMM|nr:MULTISPECIES: hypothetical protein [Salinicola]WFF42272.1 hypothetical protein EVC62_12570 [Salinicola endophyticus]
MTSRARLACVLLLLSLLGGCLALPQLGVLLGRIALSSLGVDNVRIGNYHFAPGLAGIDERTLLNSGLALAGLPVNIDLPLALSLPANAPAIELQGFSWELQVPGAEAVAGEFDQPVPLRGGETTTVTLPAALEPRGIDALPSRAQKVASLLDLARRLSTSGELPPGSRLSLTPALPPALARVVSAPTVQLDVGGESGSEPIETPTQ